MQELVDTHDSPYIKYANGVTKILKGEYDPTCMDDIDMDEDTCYNLMLLSLTSDQIKWVEYFSNLCEDRVKICKVAHNIDYAELIFDKLTNEEQVEMLDHYLSLSSQEFVRMALSKVDINVKDFLILTITNSAVYWTNKILKDKNEKLLKDPDVIIAILESNRLDLVMKIAESIVVEDHLETISKNFFVFSLLSQLDMIDKQKCFDISCEKGYDLMIQSSIGDVTVTVDHLHKALVGCSDISCNMIMKELKHNMKHIDYLKLCRDLVSDDNDNIFKILANVIMEIPEEMGDYMSHCGRSLIWGSIYFKNIMDKLIEDLEVTIEPNTEICDEECIICFSSECDWKCPHCECHCHSSCITDWYREKKKCPNCIRNL